MYFRALKLILPAIRVNLGIHRFALYRLYKVDYDFQNFPRLSSFYLNDPFARENISRIISSCDLSLKIDHYK